MLGIFKRIGIGLLVIFFIIFTVFVIPFIISTILYWIFGLDTFTPMLALWFFLLLALCIGDDFVK